MAKQTATKQQAAGSKRMSCAVEKQSLLVTIAPSKKWKPEPGYPAFIDVRLPFSLKAHKERSLGEIRRALKDALRILREQIETQVKAAETQGTI